jgi:hypothetical protein
VDAQNLKDDAAKAAEAKAAATNAAVATAAKFSKAKTAIIRCGEAGHLSGQYVSAGPNTSCAFAENVFKGMIAARWDAQTRVSRAFDVYSPTTGGSYKMTCKLGGTIVCRGGKGAVVYLPGSNPGQDQYFNLPHPKLR